jgi:hypothetical protein
VETEHKVIATPSFQGGFNLRITGRNRNDIKEYIAEEFYYLLAKDSSVVVINSREIKP